MRAAALIGLVVSLGAMPATRSSVLVVSVGDARTGGFVVDGQVRLPTLGRIERTKWNGEARFADVAEGRYRVQVRAIGYAPGEIDLQVKGDTASVHFELEKLNPLLDTVRVTASRAERHLAEFETRRKQNIGRFITDSVIFAERERGMQQLLISHVPGLKAVGRGVKAMEPQLMGYGSRRIKRSTVDGCPVAIYLDGVEFSDPDLDFVRLDELNLEDMAGIESYTRAAVPVQYRPLGNYCKVILLWTKW